MSNSGTTSVANFTARIIPSAGGVASDVNVHDGAGNSITSTVVGGDTGLDVNIIGGIALGTVDQGNPNALLSKGWPVKITDGTNVLGTSTNPIVSDVTPGTPVATDYLPVRLTNGTIFDPIVVVSSGVGTLTVGGSVSLTSDKSDLDTGAGNDPHEVIAIGLPGPGGHVVGGTVTNPLNVNIVSGAGSTGIVEWDDAAVAASAETLIVSYTVPVGQAFYLSRVEASGENMARYTVKVGAATVGVKRSYFTHFNVDFTFADLKIPAGTTVTVTAYHTRLVASNHEASIQGELI